MKAIKIGGSFITDKLGYKRTDSDNMKKIARAIKKIHGSGDRMILVHGAGSFGHNLVKEHGIIEAVRSEEQKLGHAKTHLSCAELSSILAKILTVEAVPVITLDPASIIIQKGKRIDTFNDKILYDYLDSGFVPMLRGDMVIDHERGGSVCSGDQIIAHIGRKAELIAFVTDVDGVLNDQGELIPEINKDNYESISRYLKPKENDVTGAMKGKIWEMLGLDVPSYILNGEHPQRLVDIILGRGAKCTKIIPG